MGFRTLFAMPARALWNTSVELDDIVRSVGRELWERRQEAEGGPQRFAVCDEVLTRLLRDDAVVPDEFGLGPKLAARVVRFERARRMIQAVPPHVTIAQIAAVCGYYDQAHLARDFAELAGCSPTQWLVEEELPSFQDADGQSG